MRVLGIQTAVSIPSVAVIDGEEIIAEKDFSSHERLCRMVVDTIDKLLGENGMKPRELEGIGVAKGPGSFTGIRIGISVAKGLSMGLNIPVSDTSTLEGLVLTLPYTSYPICSLIPSRGEEVYMGLYEFSSRDLLRKVEEETTSTLDSLLKKISKPTIFIGEGARKYKNLLKRRLGKCAIFAPPSLNDLRASTVAFQVAKKLKKTAEFSSFNLKAGYIRSFLE